MCGIYMITMKTYYNIHSIKKKKGLTKETNE